MELGVNLSFAVKRWVEPESWARVVRQDLGLDLVQFTYDLVDPWWPRELRSPLAARIKKAAADQGIKLHSAFAGLASYTFNQLLHPLPEGRQAAMQWFKNAIDFAGELEVGYMGGPAGALSADESQDPDRVAERYAMLLESLSELTEHAKRRGLKGLMIEPTPLRREFPWSIESAQKMQKDLQGRIAVPVQWCLDWGHAIYQPLYADQAKDTLAWLNQLGRDMGMIHLQQSDGQLDCHWSFAHEGGIVDPGVVAREIRQAGLDHLPVFLEVFFPFESTNQLVMSEMKKSFEILKPIFTG